MKQIVLNLVDKFSQNKNRVYIVPTKIGFLYIAVNFVIFMFGLTYANNMSLLLAFLCFSFIIINMIIANHNLDQIKEFSLETIDDFQFQALLKLQTDNKSAQNIELFINGLELKQEQLGHLIQSAAGKYSIKIAKVFTTYPAGLFYVWKYLHLDQSVHVYPIPKKWDLKSIHSTSSKSILNNSDFLFHIPYQVSMPANKIDWKVYARNEQLYWKKHEGEVHHDFEFNYLNMPSKHHFEKLQMLSYAIEYAYGMDASFSLILPSKTIKSSKGLAHYHVCQRELSSYANKN